MKDSDAQADIWGADRLGFARVGQSFSKIVHSFTESRVISIEAPFGYGKTFFSHAWARQLRAEGQLVIQIDAQLSDKLNDPIATFIGALLTAQPVSGKPLTERMKKSGVKLVAAVGRGLVQTVVKHSADDVLDAITSLVELPDGPVPLSKVVEDLKGQLSKAAYQMIAVQLAAEEARTKELPAQIDALRDALLEGTKNKQIIILIDELDRCHPEYAISLLEAMKMVFGRDGFVFCLMVNPNYLENIAANRFGTGANDELYLEKFVDLRLKLPANPEQLALAVQEMASKITLTAPFGDKAVFGAEPAALLIKEIVQHASLSIRQIKRLIERIDLITRLYADQPIDLPLLSFMAFEDVLSRGAGENPLGDHLLARARFSPEVARQLVTLFNNARSSQERDNARYRITERFSDLVNLPPARFTDEHRNLFPEYRLAAALGPTYLPNHRAMLEGIKAMHAD